MSGGAHQLFDPEAPPLCRRRRRPPAPSRRARSGGAEPPHGRPDPGSAVSSPLAASTRRSRAPWPRPSPGTATCGCAGRSSTSRTTAPGTSTWTWSTPTTTPAPAPRGRGGVPTLNVKCWRSSWAPLRHALAKEGIELAEGMVVVLRGSLDLYRAKGEISLILAEIDVTALLGRMAAQRGRAAAQARGRGPAPAQRVRSRVPDVTHARRACRQSRDRGLPRLPRPAHRLGVRLPRLAGPRLRCRAPTRPPSIARALKVLSRSDCDVIAMVRGGGARADLAAFETEVVARAVAGATKPVFTGIGHTGDETVADIVAARACITPTECGHQIVVSTRRWWAAHVAEPAELLARRVPAFLGDAQARDAPGAGPPHRGGAAPAARAPGAPGQQGVVPRAVGARPARVARGGGAGPGGPARAAEPRAPRPPGRAGALVAPAARRLRRGAPARARATA